MTEPADLPALLGLETMAHLSGIIGGTTVDVPVGLNEGLLRKRIGDSAFALLVFHYGGQRVYIPQAGQARRSVPKKINAAEVLRLTRDGWSAERIARHLGCSDRTVRAKRKIRVLAEGQGP